MVSAIVSLLALEAPLGRLVPSLKEFLGISSTNDIGNRFEKV